MFVVVEELAAVVLGRRVDEDVGVGNWFAFAGTGLGELVSEVPHGLVDFEAREDFV